MTQGAECMLCPTLLVPLPSTQTLEENLRGNSQALELCVSIKLSYRVLLVFLTQGIFVSTLLYFSFLNPADGTQALPHISQALYH